MRQFDPSCLVRCIALQGVLRNALRKVDEPPEAAGVSGAATGAPAAAAAQSATATTAQSPSTASPAGKRRKPRSRSKAAEAEDRLPLFTERLKAVLVSELRRALPETWVRHVGRAACAQAAECTVQLTFVP